MYYQNIKSLEKYCLLKTELIKSQNEYKNKKDPKDLSFLNTYEYYAIMIIGFEHPHHGHQLP